MAQMKIAFLGLGRRSRGFLAGLQSVENVQVVAGCDSWPLARRHANQTAPGLRAYGTPAELFEAHREIDLAMVFSRDCDHEAHTLAALVNGCDVFVEKPMATSAAACERMLDAAGRAGRRIMVGFNLRFHPVVREARRFIDQGRLGRIRAIWEWHEVDLNYFHNWMSVRANSGGLLFQKGTHDLDLFNWFAGSDAVRICGFGGLDYYGGREPDNLHCPDCPRQEDCFERVRDGHLVFPGDVPYAEPNAEQTKCAFRAEIDVCDSHVLSILYANGIKASYTELHGSPLPQRRFALFGEKGRLEFDVDRDWLRWLPRNRKEQGREWTCEKSGAHGGADKRLLDAIVAAFRDGGDVPVGGPEGLAAVRMAEAGEEAIRTQQAIAL